METVNEKVTGGELNIQYLVHNGPVELRRGCSSKKCHLHLYRDFLVVTNSRYKINFKIKYIIPLTALWMGECVVTDFVGPSRARKSVLLGWPMENFVATFRSSAQKREWCTFLQRSINEKKEKDRGKSITLEILTEDIPSWNTYFTVTAARLDTANDIIKKLRPMLGIPNAEEDYQLWFSSTQEEEPCPLLGHENPYAIRMSDLRNSTFVAVGPHDYIDYLDINKAIQELQAPHAPGRFILKPRDPPKDQSSSKKTVRRRSSFMNWIFRRGHDYVRLDTPTANTGQLFGKPLIDICEDGELPAQILDMLSVINDKGQDTKGIFRKSANVTSCQALKEKLDSGEKVDLCKESVHVVASVFKDFLRNIQGGVLTWNIYEKCFDAIDQKNEEKRISAVQSVLKQLPKPNFILLRHLFRVLNKIDSKSSINHMTAYNLSVCIAPSIMWLPGSCNSGSANDISKKIFLVQYLTENYLKIFADDTNAILGKSLVTCNNSERILDTFNTFNNFVDFGVSTAAQGDGGSSATERAHPESDDAAFKSPSAPSYQARLTVNMEQPFDSRQLNASVFCKGTTAA